MQTEKEAFETPLSGPGGMWTRRLKDKFFAPALVDVAFITIVGLCLPSEHSDVHLALIVAVIVAWLFRNAFRVFLLWLAIAVCLLSHWYWYAYWSTGEHLDILGLFSLDTHAASSPAASALYKGTFLGTTGPRISFWFLSCLLMIVMRAVRRETEDQAAFFRSLAEAMPFEVFVKDADRRFIFANHKLLRRLRRLPRNQDLTLRSLQGRSDEDLGIPEASRMHYERIDQEILDGKRNYYEELEDPYIEPLKVKILTIKVPVVAGSSGPGEIQRPAYVLGLCRDPSEDSDPIFFLDIVGSRQAHCFFRKRGGVFSWGNDQFLIDANIKNLARQGLRPGRHTSGVRKSFVFARSEALPAKRSFSSFGGG